MVKASTHKKPAMDKLMPMVKPIADVINTAKRCVMCARLNE